eukprot:1166836-Amphidinium_carterae.1
MEKPLRGKRACKGVCGELSCKAGRVPLVIVCATSVDAHPKQLPPHQPWQPPGETMTEHVRAELWREHPPPEDPWWGGGAADVS